MKHFLILPVAAALIGCSPTGKPGIPIKAVVVSMFENGEHTGDQPGEMQFWVERGNFDRKLEFPLGLHDLYHREDGLLLTCTGGGVTNATTSIMALGMDPRFDFSKASWVVAGIAGAGPDDATIGDAIWAYFLTKDIDLGDDPEVAAFRRQFTGRPNATRPPKVLIGDTLGSSTYWHGDLLNEWANNWMKLPTGGEANFMTTNMEDNGTLTALHRMARTGLVDAERILVLRTASNFSAPPPGKVAVWSTTGDYPADSIPAKEAAYTAANTVVEALIKNWDTYGASTPKP